MIRLIIFFMAAMLAAGGTSIANDVSECPVDTMPIQILLDTDHRDTDRLGATTLSEARIMDDPPGFKAFVTTVTEHLAAKLAQEKICLNSAESRDRSLIQFLAMPISLSKDRYRPYPVQSLEERSSGCCRISSPWLDIVIEREPVPSVRAIVRYSERQLLADQAVLEGAPNVPPGVARPLTEDQFIQYSLKYAKLEIKKLPQPGARPIEEWMPPDLLWLLRRARSFRFVPITAVRKAMNLGAESYTAIVITLIDQCFASDGVDIKYNSILDVADPVLLEKYKIVTPLY